MSFNIAIDGPAGAGKSTIAKLVAERLSFIYVDTGAMYRAMALYFLNKKTDMQDAAQLAADIGQADISIQYVDGEQVVLLNGENVNGRIRTEEVSNMASVVSAIPEVRSHLFQTQRALAQTKDVVMDGRDIGTTILPGAQVKIFLTASVQTRAQRRLLEMQGRGETCDIEEIREDIRKRDQRDMTREISPLRQAEDAILLDSSDLSIEQVVNRILDIYREKAGAK